MWSPAGLPATPHSPRAGGARKAGSRRDSAVAPLTRRPLRSGSEFLCDGRGRGGLGRALRSRSFLRAEPSRSFAFLRLTLEPGLLLDLPLEAPRFSGIPSVVLSHCAQDDPALHGASSASSEAGAKSARVSGASGGRRSAGTFDGGRLASSNFEAISAVYGLDVEHLAAGEPQYALDGGGHVFVHTVGKFDDDHRALARSSNQAPRHGPRALSELSKDYVHTVNLALSRPTSTAVTTPFLLELPSSAPNGLGNATFRETGERPALCLPVPTKTLEYTSFLALRAVVSARRQSRCAQSRRR